MNWVILTGEYPPQPGGVSDYTWQVAHGLAAAGDAVHIFAPPIDHATPEIPGHASIVVHRLSNHYGRGSLAQIDALLKSIPQPRRLMVQYVPHAFGWKAMNVPLCRWLLRRKRQGEKIDVMFHEVSFPIRVGQPLRHRFLAHVNRRMARWVADSAERIFMSAGGWEPLLRKLGAMGSMRLLPVPSNIAHEPPASAVSEIRSRFSGATVVAHFGTYGRVMGDTLRDTMIRMVHGKPSRVLLLLGRGGSKFGDELQAAVPDLQGRVFAPGALGVEELAAHLAASDIMVQPYPDGVTCRRTSLMAGLVAGVPVVASTGPETEPLWAESGGVFLSPELSADSVVATAEAALADPVAMASVAKKGRDYYNAHFAPIHTVRALRDAV